MDKKKVFRKESLRRLKKISRREHRLASKQISSQIDSLLLKKRPKSVLFYLPLSFEPDLNSSLSFWRKRGVNIFVPFVEQDSFKMVKYRLPLKKSRFGTMESGNSHIRRNRVDMMIVPVVGVDRSWRRVGFGKGMYDRFYASLKNRPVVVFVQTVLNISKEIVTESHDIRADFIFWGE
jgi:5-formyltetrahydrofolate cyclo-ligase